MGSDKRMKQQVSDKDVTKTHKKVAVLIFIPISAWKRPFVRTTL